MMWIFLACGLSAKKIETKPDPWLGEKIEQTQDQDELILLLQEMGIRRSSYFLTTLISFCDHPIENVRKASLESLIAYGPSLDDDRRDGAYLKAISDKNNGVASLAQRGIEQRIQSEINTSFLINALLDRLQQTSDWNEQLRIISLVQWIDNDKNISILSTLAKTSTNPQVQIMAIQALGQLQASSARHLLFSLQHEALHSDVRKAAEYAIQQIGGKINDLIIAVMPLEHHGLSKEQAIGIQNYLSGSLSSAKVATVVERAQVDKLMDELIYQDRFINDNQAIEIGKSLRASQIITGSIQRTGNTVTITLKRVDIESQEILSSSQVSGLEVDLDALQRQAAQALIARF